MRPEALLPFRPRSVLSQMLERVENTSRLVVWRSADNFADGQSGQLPLPQGEVVVPKPAQFGRTVPQQRHAARLATACGRPSTRARACTAPPPMSAQSGPKRATSKNQRLRVCACVCVRRGIASTGCQGKNTVRPGRAEHTSARERGRRGDHRHSPISTDCSRGRHRIRGGLPHSGQIPWPLHGAVGGRPMRKRSRTAADVGSRPRQQVR